MKKDTKSNIHDLRNDRPALKDHPAVAPDLNGARPLVNINRRLPVATEIQDQPPAPVTRK
jgi:hypothetical protein